MIDIEKLCISLITYLGHSFLTGCLNDDIVIWRCCKLYALASSVCVHYLKLPETPLYTTHLWLCYSGMQRIIRAYSDATKLLLQVSRCASPIVCVLQRSYTCEALLRDLMFSFMCCLEESESSILKALTNQSCSLSSRLRLQALLR